ncbi:MAG: serine protease [Neomegalonema sp.]|nr:serine protease [Neomegalonema sp.]
MRTSVQKPKNGAARAAWRRLHASGLGLILLLLMTGGLAVAELAPKPPSANMRKSGLAPLTDTTPGAHPTPASRGYEPPPPLPGRGSGSGFYISKTELITNAHVVAKCADIRDAQDRKLTLIAMDRETDLALLRAATPSSHWLRLAPPSRPMLLGSGVFVLGFPFYGELGRSVVVTRGVVSSRTGYLGRRANFGVDALMRPGSSGGPVLDSAGRVIGVAVSVLTTPGFNAETTPPNVNFAVGLDALTAFLTAAKVDFHASGEPVAKLSEGLPLSFERSVVPILCD